MGKLAEINKETQENFNALMAEQLRQGASVLQRKITGAEFLQLSPYNFKTGKIYEGQNFVNLLGFSLNSLCGAWLTFKQITELGGQIKQGAAAQKIVFWSFNEKRDELDEKSVKYCFLKRFNVFNLADTTLENLPHEAPQKQEVEQMRESVVQYVKANYIRLHGAENDGADFNRFFANVGFKNYGEICENKFNNFYAGSNNWAAATLVGELLNLFICAKIGANFTPVFSKNWAQKWAPLLESSHADFLKLSKIAKQMGDEMLTWEALAKVGGESYQEPLRLQA